jgi:hypothetical protein
LNKKIGALVALLVFGFIVLVLYSTIAGTRHRVRVCMAYNGRTACKTVAAKSEDSAVRSAVNNACADITSGVTEVMGCEASKPESVTWLGGTAAKP